MSKVTEAVSDVTFPAYRQQGLVGANLQSAIFCIGVCVIHLQCQIWLHYRDVSVRACTIMVVRSRVGGCEMWLFNPASLMCGTNGNYMIRCSYSGIADQWHIDPMRWKCSQPSRPLSASLTQCKTAPYEQQHIEYSNCLP
jgi:hypothetical protein